MKQTITLGVTNRTVCVFIPDPASTDGSGKTGLVAANLTVSYTRVETDNDVVVTDATSSLSDLSALTDAHSDWGLKEVSSTLAPGLYRLDLADAVFASGAWSAVVYVMITTSAAAASPMEFILVADDPLITIADAVWDEATSGHVTSGSFGEQFYAIRSNTAQAGAATTITLDASASAVDDFYNNTIIVVTGGTGAGQSRIISDYVGATKVATVPTWATNPSSDSTFVIIPFGAVTASAPTADEVANAVWDEATAGHTTSGTFGEQLKTDVDAVLAKTAQLTFTAANQVDANVQYVNDVQVTGAGTSGNPWGPA
jgi:hypothetical protein